MNKSTSDRLALAISIAVVVVLFTTSTSFGEPADQVPPDLRCTVCGMFVARHPDWIARISYETPNTVQFFDGVKDMLVFYFAPERFGAAPSAEIREIRVKDYYTLEWLDGRKAFYVIGSDVYGPMGHELIPFNSLPAAESFMNDHRARKILTFDQLTPELVESMQTGQKMR